MVQETGQSSAHTWTQESVEDWLIARISQILECSEDDIDPEMPFNSFGLDSVSAVNLMGELDDLLNIETESTIIWDYPTVSSLSEFVLAEHQSTLNKS